MKDIAIRSTQYLLKNCPRPQDISGKGIEPLARMLKEVSRGKLGGERAEALYRAAKESVGIIEGSESIVMEIKESVSTIENMEKFVKEIEKHISRHLREVPYSRFILSLKGVGEITTAGLIGEFGDLRKYRTIGEVIKHAGLDLYEIRDLETTKLPFMMFLYCKKGGAAYEDIDFGSEWSINRTGGLDFAFG